MKSRRFSTLSCDSAFLFQKFFGQLFSFCEANRSQPWRFCVSKIHAASCMKDKAAASTFSYRRKKRRDRLRSPNFLFKKERKSGWLYLPYPCFQKAEIGVVVLPNSPLQQKSAITSTTESAKPAPKRKKRNRSMPSLPFFCKGAAVFPPSPS